MRFQSFNRAFCLLFLLGLGAFPWGLNAEPLSSYLYGADAEEADIRFEDSFLLDMSSFGKVSKVKNRYEDYSDEEKEFLSEAVKLQVLHLYGVFSYHETPIDFSYYSGAILESQDPVILHLEKDGEKLRVHYSYQDRAVFYKPLFKFLGKSTELRFYLPNEPREIFLQTQVKSKKTQKLRNPCTDQHDQEGWGFWYYWSPSRKGCRSLIQNHIHEVVASIVPRESTVLTYPEYSKLFHPKDGVVNVRILYGQDEKFGDEKDTGRRTFESEFRIFRSWKVSAKKPRFVVEKDEPFYKRLRSDSGEASVLLELYYVDTDGEVFDETARHALKNSDVMIYAGHSYEGYYFDLARLFEDPQAELPKGEYQIFYFDACTTYSYYGNNYFSAKTSAEDLRGTKSLDLLTNGIGAPFLVDDPSGEDRNSNTTVFLRSLLGWSKSGRALDALLSWQDILKRITQNSGVDFTSLTLVKGDEDNPRQYEPSWLRP